MNLSKRILTIVNEIEYDTIADIGTDHGYIPIEAIQSNKASFAIACDLNKECVNKASTNILSNNLGDKIKTRLGDGLKPVLDNEVSSVIISGMGGHLINNILDEKLKDLTSIKQLILSPHTKIELVRENIYKLGFFIEKEKIVYEDLKYYFILNCKRGTQKYINKFYFSDYLLNSKDEVYFNFLNTELSKTHALIDKIKTNENNMLVDKYNMLNEVIINW